MNAMDYDDLIDDLRGPLPTRHEVQAANAIEKLRARVAELEQRQVYWTCTVGGETFTTQDHEVCDSWAEDYPVRVCVADDPRVAELEAENERLTRERQWRPMDTLPDPGSHILVYYPFSGAGHVEDAHVYDDGDGRYIVLFDGDMLDVDPTHWMPYPRMGLNSANEPDQERVEIEGE